MGQDGVIRYEGDKFRRNFSLGRVFRFMGEEGMGRPFAEADAQVQALRELLTQAGLSADVEIENIVVFYNPRAVLNVAEPPRPTVTPKELKKFIRKAGTRFRANGIANSRSYLTRRQTWKWCTSDRLIADWINPTGLRISPRRPVRDREERFFSHGRNCVEKVGVILGEPGVKGSKQRTMPETGCSSPGKSAQRTRLVHSCPRAWCTGGD